MKTQSEFIWLRTVSNGKTPVNTVMNLPLLGRAGCLFIIQFCLASVAKWKEDISKEDACPHFGHTLYTEARFHDENAKDARMYRQTHFRTHSVFSFRIQLLINQQAQPPSHPKKKSEKMEKGLTCYYCACAHEHPAPSGRSVNHQFCNMRMSIREVC